ncbi:response regulator [Lactovum miscens]|uniref:Two-component system KDP operon response regulator KdpE n=1 Tax=Lactovum miscens TaxID=190387 RepID=A0A841C4R4_9LACT|nr:response regulator transcription factor [Lactovum miscens]MBB5887803.1 two-component system KDP operon response regulator KdpE [Lactovum miscens]
MAGKANIIICEDDPSINKLLSVTMEVEGYDYRSTKTGKQCLHEIVSKLPDILLLDMGLPDMDGVEIIEKVRGFSNLPIIVISARGEDSDKIQALDAGADDYLTKPFSTDELLARLRVNQRRQERFGQMSQVEEESQIFENGWLRIDFDGGSVFVQDKEIHLTPIEYKLLCLLANNLNRVLTYHFITKEIWGYNDYDFAALRVFATTLRKKIEIDPSNPQLIQTHIGVGYRMNRID